MMGREIDEADFAVQVAAQNGGKLVGKTRFQKTVFLLQKLLGVDKFNFDYHHFGPFSEELADAIDIATARNRIAQDSKFGFYNMPYTVFSTAEGPAKSFCGVPSQELKRWLAKIEATDAIALELAATRLFLISEQGVSPKEVEDQLRQLKPQKATKDKLDKSKRLLEELGL